MSHFTKTEMNELSSLPDVAVVEYSVPTDEMHNQGSRENSQETPSRIIQNDISKFKHKQKFHKVHSSVNIANNTLRTPTGDE